MIDMSEIATAAVRIAEKNAEAEPNLLEVYLFPDKEGKEIRLVEVEENALPNPEGIEPFYFAADPVRDLPFALAVAQIRPEEKGVVQPPEEWDGWEDAIRIWPKGGD